MANSYGFDPVAWSIDGGRHVGELLRVFAYVATGASEGIVSPGDCKVNQLPTPGGQVSISTGGLLIRNRSTNVKNQSYVANGRSETRLDVTPTGSSPRSDLVVVRIEDPAYAPWPTPSQAQAPDYQYTKPFIIENVPSSTKFFSQLTPTTPYSAYALARLDIPANTGTITNAMIKDLRKVAQPRRERKLLSVSMGVDTPVHDADTVDPNWENWPNAAAPFDVPTWASEMIVRVLITGVYLPAGPVGLSMRAAYSLFNGPVLGASATTPVIEVVGSGQRVQVEIADQLVLPAAARGTTQYIYTQASKFPGGAGGSGTLRAGNGTRVVYDIEFIEAAV